MASQNAASDEDTCSIEVVAPRASPERHSYGEAGDDDETKATHELERLDSEFSVFPILKQCANCNLNSRAAWPFFNVLDIQKGEELADSAYRFKYRDDSEKLMAGKTCGNKPKICGRSLEYCLKCHSLQMHNHFSRQGALGQKLHLGGFSPVVSSNVIRICNQMEQKTECYSVVFTARPRSSPAIAVTRIPKMKPDLKQDENTHSQHIHSGNNLRTTKIASASSNLGNQERNSEPVTIDTSPPKLDHCQNASSNRRIHEQHRTPDSAQVILSSTPPIHSKSILTNINYQSNSVATQTTSSKNSLSQSDLAQPRHNKDCRKRSFQGNFTQTLSPKLFNLFQGGEKQNNNSGRENTDHLASYGEGGPPGLYRGAAICGALSRASHSFTSSADMLLQDNNYGNFARTVRNDKLAANPVVFDKSYHSRSDLFDDKVYSAGMQSYSGIKDVINRSISVGNKDKDNNNHEQSCFDETVKKNTYGGEIVSGSTLYTGNEATMQPQTSKQHLIPRVIIDDYDDYDDSSASDMFDPTTINDQRLSTWTSDDVVRFLQQTDCKEFASTFQHQDIDGKALIIFNEEKLNRLLGIKIGPAMKIVSHINNLKRCLSQRTDVQNW